MNNEQNSFNLIDEPWIPVLTRDGANKLVSLDEMFADQTGDIADLALNPYERVSVFRLLLCIVQAALGPERLKDEAAWLGVKSEIGLAALEYLGKWHDRFFLYGPHAFLQSDDLNTAKSEGFTSVDKLVFRLASGNNSTLFDHAAGIGTARLVSAQLAVGLVSYQNFSAGGLSGICIWSGEATEKSVKGAPCREQSMLLSIVLGESLLESVWLNLLTADNVIGGLSSQWGQPAWELDGLSRKEAACLSNTFLGHLAPFARVIKLSPGSSSCVIGGGVVYPPLPEWREPMATVKPNRQEQASYVSTDPARMPWRDLASILAVNGGGGRKSALAMRHLTSIPEQSVFSIWTGGLYSEKAKEINTVEWKLNLSVEMLEESALRQYQNAIDHADKQRQSLYFASAEYARVMLVDDVSRFSVPAERAYWDILAQSENQRLVQAVSSPTYFDDWKKASFEAAKKAYERACSAVTARQMEAFAQGYAKLTVK